MSASTATRCPWAQTTWFLVAGVALAGCTTTEYVHVGPNWDAAQKLEPSKDAFDVQVDVNDDLRVGEPVVLTVRSKGTGRLWVVQVDPSDELDLLFPNEQHPDNAIAANEVVRIPPEGAGWSIRASEPAGKSLIVAIVTSGETKLESVLASGGGKPEATSAEEKVMPKALRLMQQEPDRWGLSRRVVDVRKAP